MNHYNFFTGTRLLNITESPYYYRMTESQNGRGWKGPLWII